MNPYLEHPSVWQDFHQSFIPAAREVLTPQVGPAYFVQVGEHIYIQEDPDRRLAGVADLDVARDPNRPGNSAGATATLTAPTEVTIPEVVKRRVPYLEVRDRRDRRVVTVLELLSPSNKYAGEDRESYLTKRKELLASAANFVELDLLRGGPRLPLRGLPACDYYAMVSRPAKRPKADVWAVRLRNPLPRIPVPLGPGGTDAVLDLQAVLHRVYDGAGYASHIYDVPPEPALAPADAAWAAGLVPTPPA
jgi:hypothetical protein